MDDFSRYERQMKLEDFGTSGQRRLAASRLLVVGAGGVGSGALELLAGAGVGKIFVADCDTVSMSNLHRQTLFGESDLGKSKADCAAAVLKTINSTIDIVPLNLKVREGDLFCEELFKQVDIVLDASDSFSSRLAVCALCEKFAKPEILASAQNFKAQNFLFAENFYFDKIIADFRQAQSESAAALPIFAPAAHISGAMAAAEIIRALVSDFASFEVGTFIDFDLRTMKFFKGNIKTIT